MEKGCNTRLDEAQYTKNSSKAPFIQQSLNSFHESPPVFPMGAAPSTRIKNM